MKIIRFSFEDKELEWKLEEIKFNKLNLLVGASGVGKTQILKALLILKEIVEGESPNGVKWFIEFETLGNQNCIWEGEFENKKGFPLIEGILKDSKINRPKITFEKLDINGKEIVNRNNETIVFNGQQTLKLLKEESILHLLKEEDLIKPVYESLRKINFSDYSDSVNAPKLVSINNIASIEKPFEEFDNIEKIQNSEIGIILKLFYSSKIENDNTFSRIKQRFNDIFPQIEDIKVATLNSKDVPSYLKDFLFIQIKQENVTKWIDQLRISSGMFRTLLQLSELYLCKEGTVFLIDEFENSLGINCINEITTDILTSRRQLQFILTSHHPYIINNIEFKNWKLVTRNGGIIKAHDMSEFNFGNSKHEAFMQLLQLDEYQTGQEQL
ncbi:ATP-binding protein (plasmid) [Bernardetia sp. Wsw4-3y2]|uniref:ATP-binding protein n=1 Tax=Bernardetia sp. Wsw4-3y2 TaxID=3127471 RepID=UPI0030CF102D